MPVSQAHEKGAQRHKSRKYPPYEDFGFSCKLSDKDWYNLPGQIEDAATFLKKYEDELYNLTNSYSIDSIKLVFPYYCLHSKKVFLQCTCLPSELLAIAGKLNIAIELSLYQRPQKTLLERILKKFGSSKKPEDN